MTVLYLYLVVWGGMDWAFAVSGSDCKISIDLCRFLCFSARLSPPPYFPMDTERPIDLYIFIYLHIYVLSKSRDFCLMWKKQLSLVSNKCRKANWSYANIVICFLNPGRPNDERSGPALSPSANEVYLHYIKVIIKVLYGNQGLKKVVRVITAIKKQNLSQRGKGRES